MSNIHLHCLVRRVAEYNSCDIRSILFASKLLAVRLPRARCSDLSIMPTAKNQVRVNKPLRFLLVLNIYYLAPSFAAHSSPFRYSLPWFSSKSHLLVSSTIITSCTSHQRTLFTTSKLQSLTTLALSRCTKRPTSLPQPAFYSPHSASETPELYSIRAGSMQIFARPAWRSRDLQVQMWRGHVVRW